VWMASGRGQSLSKAEGNQETTRHLFLLYS
jgi:hypothetical protein